MLIIYINIHFVKPFVEAKQMSFGLIFLFIMEFIDIGGGSRPGIAVGHLLY